MEEKKSFFSFIKFLFGGINFLRKLVLNVIFVIIAVFVLSLMFSGDSKPVVPGQAVLVLNPSGFIVEQKADGGLQGEIKKSIGYGAQSETLLKDVIDSIRSASTDSRIKAIYLDLNSMGWTGLTKLQDIKDAIADFRKSGKKIIAYGDNLGQSSYYLAAHADEIYMHNMGMLMLEGYSVHRHYYKEGLDKFGIEYNIFKVGKYKSAVEPYMRETMSDEVKAVNLKWLNVLWDTYLADVSAARKIKVEELKNYVENYNEVIAAAKGDTAKAALNAKLITAMVDRNTVKQKLIKISGKDSVTQSFNKINFRDYLKAVRPVVPSFKSEEVAVIVARGVILDGKQPAGKIGGDSTAALIRKAREDKKVKAIVLRVDSGGGSAFASEVIRKELELARAEGKPVVSSMSSVAASGGYWITMSSDTVFAYPSTITGSIGIFGMIPTYQKPLKKYAGIQVDGVGTTKFAGTFRSDKKLSPDLGATIQHVINKGYNSFITRVAKARKMSLQDVDKVAQGRVWSGKDALKAKLIDKLGTLNDAIKHAAELAKLKKGYGIRYIEKEKSFKEKMIAELLGTATAESSNSASRSAIVPNVGIVDFFGRQLEIMSNFNDPQGIYAYFPYAVY